MLEVRLALFWFFDIEEMISFVFNSTFPRRSPKNTRIQ